LQYKRSTQITPYCNFPTTFDLQICPSNRTLYQILQGRYILLLEAIPECRYSNRTIAYNLAKRQLTLSSGYHTVFHLAKHNAKVYLGARSEAKATTKISEIKSQIPNADVRFLKMDLMNLGSVVSAAQEFLSEESRLHGLVNNAGIMATAFEVTSDGYEAQWQTNYLSHWVLTQHVLPTMLATAENSQPGDVRIVNVTSIGHNVAPKGGIDFDDINQLKGGVWSRYGQSKLGNILFSKELNQRYGPDSSAVSKIWTASVHPGAVDT
jgi:NAD(P)-dependent dehydrogenase (short-subunit alcohol dehydrogenase family)